jgi:serine/threonine protein kinase HipA of HipAB toxin-antitoxin module
MKELEFESYLLDDKSIKSKIKAVKSRINKAKMVERHFNNSLDNLVCNDEVMFETLKRIKNEMNDTNGTISNSVRKYYVFCNKKCFPTLKEYHK